MIAAMKRREFVALYRRRGSRLAHGFTAEQMMTLLRANLATVTAERMVAAGRKIEVAATIVVTEAKSSEICVSIS